jgi:hypothetical protein
MTIEAKFINPCAYVKAVGLFNANLKYQFQNVSSIMKCNTLESERDFVILRMYALKLPTSWIEGT